MAAAFLTPAVFSLACAEVNDGSLLYRMSFSKKYGDTKINYALHAS